MQARKVVAITGASSGLGAALARHYAAEAVTLHLQGRDEARLYKVAEACRQKLAHVTTRVLDVRDADAMQDWLSKADDHAPIELLFANAGISGGSAQGVEGVEQVQAIVETNLHGVLNSLHPVIPRMVQRQGGQLVIISSLAGLRGLPSAPAYSASKCAVRAYGEALRPLLAKEQVGVTVVCPGFIRTPLTDVNPFPMPLRMEPEQAAALIARRLEKNPGRIAFPYALYAPLRLLDMLPVPLVERIVRLLPGK